MRLFKKPRSREERKYRIIGILVSLIIAIVFLFIFFWNLDQSYYKDLLQDDKIGFIIYIICLAIACFFAYITIVFIIYAIINWLIAISIYYFSKTKNKKIKEEAKRYLFDDEYNDL